MMPTTAPIVKRVEETKIPLGEGMTGCDSGGLMPWGSTS
jgi:hypothetical protein